MPRALNGATAVDLRNPPCTEYTHRIDARREELQGFLENQEYAEQHEKIRAAITLYDLGVVPHILRSVNLQGRRAVPLKDFTMRITDHRPYWVEVNISFS